MRKEKQDIVVRELTALGDYWRWDWSGFDGRTLQAQLDRLAGFIEGDAEDFTAFSDMRREQLEGDEG